MLNIAICDNCVEDSRQLRRLVEEILSEYAIRYNLQMFETGEELLCSSVAFDLIFLDAASDGGTGIATGEKLYRANRAVKIVFSCQSSQDCEEAVNRSHAFSCIKKPTEKPVLETQFRDFLEAWGDAQTAWISLGQAAALSAGNEEQMVRLPVRDILYFECQKNGKTIKAVTDRGEFLYQGALGDAEEKMEPFGFAVCSRGILVNLTRIARLEGYEVIMANGVKLPLSQRRNKEFKRNMNEFYYNNIAR